MRQFEPVGSSRTRSVDTRILSATNAPIHQEIEKGRFRQDLLYRLNTVEISTCRPLRERHEDLPLLAKSFLDRHALRYRQSRSPALAVRDSGSPRLLMAGQYP